ncbi:MAG: aminoacyl-tRNA hydrolase [Deltaproteobacteria bacterium]|nr:MAG: aminoacyl-tRNA hydrolase [Deltaproteobacteria bacterium]
MSSDMWLVAGLGNPGSGYEGNRHNTGFMLIDYLVEKFGIPLDKTKFNGVFGKGFLNKNSILLVKPFSYMNMSGLPLRALSDYFNVDVSRIIIAYDDLDLPTGQIRIRKKGGAGGHKGVKSIIETFGTENIGRIKIGIGRPERREQVVSYVLHDFESHEKDIIKSSIEKAAGVVEDIIQKGYTVCMNNFN